MLKIVNLLKAFDGVIAINNVSMKIEPNEVTAIIGPNGAGKTTLFNLITGFLQPDRGKINFNGHDLTQLPPYRIVRIGISRTFQDLRLIRQMNVIENVMLARKHQPGELFYNALFSFWKDCESKHSQVALDLLDFVGLADKANQRAEALSYGQQKLLSFACCLAAEADLVLFDEPVAGVEPNTLERLIELIRKLPEMNRTVLFIEHNLEVVRHLGDRIIVMDEGKIIAEGNWGEVSRDANVLEAYLV